MNVVRLVPVVALALGVLVPPSLEAHPLGNFSINRYAGLRINAERIEIAYVIDMAEIPAFQEIQAHGLVPDPEHPSVRPYLRGATESLREGLHLEVNGSRRLLQTASSGVLFPAGAGDLPTLRLRAVYWVDLEAMAARPLGELRYRDANFSDRAGWKEIVAVAGAGASLTASSVPEQDRSRALSDYPEDLLDSPPQDIEARVLFAVTPGPKVAAVSASPPPVAPARVAADAAPVERGPIGEKVVALPKREPIGERDASPVLARPIANATPRSSFTQLVTPRELSLGVILLAVVTALGVGAAHALEPGHGKTIVAAYLVGGRGTAWHAVLLGFVVTASHTAGVFLLGLVTLYASRYMVPERLYPWLGAVSGLTIAGLGAWLFLQRFAGGDGHHPGHSHDHPHPHAHAHDHGDSHDRARGHDLNPTDGHASDLDHHHAGEHRGEHGHHHHASPATLRELFTLGITGGIVPCPAALVVLVSAIALQRTGFGLVLIVAFSVGLASVLVGIGLLMVYARRVMTRIQGDGPLVRRWLPLASAAIITALGVTIAVQALVAGGIVQIRL
jgi:ABC-type nickel/cobalt efflux system permease component RcnA